MAEHFMTDGHVTVTRDDATPQHLFDLAHDLLDRVDGLEWAFMCAVLIQLRHMEVVSDPGEATVQATLESLQAWLANYERDRKRIEQDQAFMDAEE